MNINIGSRFKEIRISNNLSANKLAKYLGVDPSTLTKIENGNSLPSMKLLINFCDYFNISLSNFFATNNKSVTYPEHFKTFFEENKNLSSEQLTKLAEFLKTLK